MACHEMAALRLGMMSLIGIDDAAERQHELAELGNTAEQPGPLRSLMQARNLRELRQLFEASLGDLGDRVARTAADDPKLPYLRSLLVLTKKVELELRQHHGALERFWHDLEEMHDYVHEIHPAR
jgi:hypothetical protein